MSTLALEERLGATLTEHLRAYIDQQLKESTSNTQHLVTTPLSPISALPITPLAPPKPMVASQSTTNNDEALYIDLLIVNDDISLNEYGCTQHVDGRASIAQDIKHMIRETGLLFKLIGERDWERRRLNMNKIERHMDDDLRLIPSTSRVIESSLDKYFITADTYDFGRIEFFL